MTSQRASTRVPNSSPTLVALLPILAAVLAAFLIVGLSLPVLPLYVHGELGFDTIMVGLVTGSQFLASLLSRPWAGQACDRYGAKCAVLIGLAAACGAGVLYLLSYLSSNSADLPIVCLLTGRGVLGIAESFIMTGSTVWGLSRAGIGSAGKVIAWIGTAMFGAMAAGAPLGVILYDRVGFPAVAGVTFLAPLIPILMVLPLHLTPPAPTTRAGMLAVVRRIWLPGLGAALSSIGFGAILAFGSLFFSERHWVPVWLPFTSYAAALMAVRLFFGHLPDRLGGARVALLCVVIEAVGLALMGGAWSGASAASGAALTGLGYSLVFPGLGIEAVRRAPPESRGLAMGAYTACLDLALGVSGPLLGLFSVGAGLRSVFLASAAVVLAAAICVLPLMRHKGQADPAHPSAGL